MATAITDANTDPLAGGSGDLDTGPQRVLELSKRGLRQRDIADLLHISQATVARRIKEAIAARKDRQRAIAMAIMWTMLTLCAVITTAAFATMAWG